MLLWRHFRKILRTGYARTLLPFVVLLNVCAAHAYAGGFIVPPAYPAGTHPASLAVADFNGDGKLDLAVVSYDGGSSDSQPGIVRILLGNGDGSFQDPQSYAAGFNSTSVAVGDFNGDGIPDLAVTNTTGSGRVSILLGNGDGTFQTAQSYRAGPYATFVVMGDFNGDGILDLAAAHYLNSSRTATAVSILLGNGDGSFQDAQQYAVPAGSWFGDGGGGSLAVGDFNRDGNLDVVTSGGGLLLGNGDGTFQAAKAFEALPNPVSMAVGDFNGDGILDLAVASLDSGNSAAATILLGQGDGTFHSNGASYPVGFLNVSLAAGDFDGDGISDLAVANERYDAVYLLRGNGDGTFQPAQNYAVGLAPKSLAVGDFNKDGHLDLVTANNFDGTVTVLLGRSDGTFPAPKGYAAGPKPVSVAVGDFNEDGIPDLVAADANGDGTVSILLGQGDGTFQPAHSYAAGHSPQFIAVGDFNGDSHLDVAVANYYPNTVTILLGNGDGTFQNAQSYAVGRNPNSVAVGDFNGDGKLDLAVTSEFDGVNILLGQGDGTFQAGQSYPVGSYPAHSVAVGDFNGDGILDFAVATGVTGFSLEGNVLIFLGNGDGTFHAAATFAAGYGPVSLAVGDFNGDGKQDIVTTNSAERAVRIPPLNLTVESDVRVYLGNGDGSFQPAQVYTAGGGPASVAVADVNADGIADLVVANAWDNKLSVLLGNGDGTFQAAQNYGVGASPRSVVVADFNRDGYADVAVANPYLGCVTVLLSAP